MSKLKSKQKVTLMVHTKNPIIKHKAGFSPKTLGLWSSMAVSSSSRLLKNVFEAASAKLPRPALAPYLRPVGKAKIGEKAEFMCNK